MAVYLNNHCSNKKPGFCRAGEKFHPMKEGGMLYRAGQLRYLSAFLSGPVR